MEVFLVSHERSELLGMDCQSFSKRQRIDTDDKNVSQYLAGKQTQATLPLPLCRLPTHAGVVPGIFGGV